VAVSIPVIREVVRDVCRQATGNELDRGQPSARGRERGGGEGTCRLG
jgi:hypothetical protein